MPIIGAKLTLINGDVQTIKQVLTDFYFGVYLVRDNLNNDYVVAEDELDGTWFETITNI